MYIPIEKWGFPITASSEETLTFLNENTDVEKLIESDEQFPVTIEQIKTLHNIQKQIHQVWQISIAAFLVLLIIRFFLGKKSLKISSMGKLLIMLGGSTLATSIMSKIASENMLSDLSRYKHPVQILFGAITTPIIAEIVKLWLLVGIGMIALGIIMIFVNSKLKKGRSQKKPVQQNMSPPTPKPLAPQPQKG